MFILSLNSSIKMNFFIPNLYFFNELYFFQTCFKTQYYCTYSYFGDLRQPFLSRICISTALVNIILFTLFHLIKSIIRYQLCRSKRLLLKSFFTILILKSLIWDYLFPHLLIFIFYRCFLFAVELIKITRVLLYLCFFVKFEYFQLVLFTLLLFLLLLFRFSFIQVAHFTWGAIGLIVQLEGLFNLLFLSVALACLPFLILFVFFQQLD